MSNPVRQLLALFCGQDSVVTIPKPLIKLTGDLNTALVLNQIIFWGSKSSRPDGWFYKSYDDWEAEILLNDRQVKYCTDKLKESFFIETMVKKVYGVRTVHYRPNLDKIGEALAALGDIQDSIKSDLKQQNCHLQNDKIVVSMQNDKIVVSNIQIRDETLTDYVCGKIEEEKPEITKEIPHTQNTNLEKLKQECLTHEKCLNAFNSKFADRDITIEEMHDECVSHYMLNNQFVSWQRFYKWINRENSKNYLLRLKESPESPESPESQKEKSIMADLIMKFQEYVGRIKADIKLGIAKAGALIPTFEEWQSQGCPV